MERSSCLNRFFNGLTCFVVLLCVAGVANSIAAQVQDPKECFESGSQFPNCEAVALPNGEYCCTCDQAGNYDYYNCGADPTPPQPPVMPPVALPRASGCPGDAGIIGGARYKYLCYIYDVINPSFRAGRGTTDLDTQTPGTEECDDCCREEFSDVRPGSGSGSCSGCGGSTSPSTGVLAPSVTVTRRLLPANQTELFSFGRGMASEFDMRLTIFPSATGDAVALLFDPRLEQTYYLEDTGSNGTYDLDDDIYYESIQLTDSSGLAVGDPTRAATETIFATVTRRNGWVYELEVCPTPLVGGEFCSRVNSMTNPQGQAVNFTYKTFTQSEIDASPARQLQIDTISDIYGNTANVSYNAQQQGGRWVISQVDLNSGESVVDYQYSTNGLLETVLKANEVIFTYTYGTDTTYNLATITWSKRDTWNHGRNDTLLLSLDYQNGDGTVVNQFMNILQGRRNGSGQVKSMIYRDTNNAGWYKILNEGRMAEVKLGESIRYYVSYTDAGTGYAGITGTLEPVWFAATNMTPALLAIAQPPTVIDETGYAVDFSYDSDGNLIRMDHADGTWVQLGYTNNNQVNYYRDRDGFVTVAERDANHNVVRVIRGMTDLAGTGSPTATAEAVQDISGYYGSGHANEKMLAWTATTAYSGSTFSAPPAAERTDYLYDANQRLIKVQSPTPHGQTNRPEVSYTWIGNQKATEVNQLGHTISFSYDATGRQIETLFADGTKSQIYYDDVNRKIYKRNRLGVVDVSTYGPSGRLSTSDQAYGRDADLSDGQIDSTNPTNEVVGTVYYYLAGVTRPSDVHRESSRTRTQYDYRGRVASVTRYPRKLAELETLHEYVNNQRFSTTTKVGTHEIKTYYGYSADRQTVRTIETRKPGVTFADNAAVLSATRLTGADPDYIINDAVRDIRGQIVQLTDPLSIQTQTAFDALGRRLTQTKTGGTLSLSSQSTYDAEGNVTQSVSETGLVTDMTYDPAGNLKTRTVAPGTSLAATWSYTYTIDGKPETVTAPDTGVTTSIYQTCCGFTTGAKNALGNGSVTNRDSAGRSVHTATLEDFDSHSNLLDPLDSKTLAETTTRYRDDGQVQFRTVWKSPLGAIDRNDPPIAGIDGVAAADGVTTQYVYDALIYDGQDLDSTAGLQIDRLGGGTANISIQAAVDKLADTTTNGGATVEFPAKGGRAGKATVVISPDEKTMQVSIADATGRSVMNASMTGPAATTPNQLITWTCTQHDQIDTTTTAIAAIKTSSIDPDGNMTHSLTDGLGRSIAWIDQLNHVSTNSFDPGGNVLKSTDALLRETDFDYDDLGRQIQITDALGNDRGTVYDSSTGQVTSRIDAKNKSTSYVYDGLGRVSAETDRLNKVTTKTYDDVGRLETLTDAENNTTTYGYNLLGQRTSTALPDGTAEAMTYDAAGRLIETELESGIKRTSIYEFSGVLDMIEYRDAGGTLTGTDDYTYDSQLRRTGSTSRDGVTRALAYTDLGQLDTDTTTYGGQSYLVDYDYDDRNRLEEITYPSGRKAAYDYTVRGELDTIDWDGSQIEERTYNEVGLLTNVDRPAVDETRAFDDLNRVTSIANTNVGDASYTYDANGNKLTESWTGVMSGWNFTTLNSGAYPDGYDAEDRFRNFKQPTKSIDLYLARTNIGNVSNRKLNGIDSFRGYANGQKVNSVGGIAQTFDTDGNLTDSHTGIELGWDEAGMLSQSIVSAGDSAGIVGTNEYGYGASQKRVWKKITRNASVVEHTVFIYAGPNCIAEYASGTAAASPDQEYVYAQAIDSLVMIVRNGGSQKLTVTRNQQWSVSALVDSSTGTVLERYTYGAFGERTILAADGATVRTSSDYSNPYGYTSRRHDEESGLIYYRARYYDSSTGDFCSKDPLGYVDGLSLYRAYFVPNGIDPSGTIYTEIIITTGLDYIVNISPDDLMLTGGAPEKIGRNEVEQWETNCCWCAKVVDWKIFVLNVETLLPLAREVIGSEMTSTGWVNALAHEARRRDVYRIGYNAYLAPANTTLPQKCGTVCHKRKGLAKEQLRWYLIELQLLAEEAFIKFKEREQAGIDEENNQQLNPDGENLEEHGGLFDHFGYIHKIGKLDEVDWPTCKESTCE